MGQELVRRAQSAALGHVISARDRTRTCIANSVKLSTYVARNPQLFLRTPPLPMRGTKREWNIFGYGRADRFTHLGSATL